MKDGIIIQARTGSTRLHNKILLPFYGGQRIIDILIGNIKQACADKTIVLATTDRPQDDILAEVAREAGICCYRETRTMYSTALSGLPKHSTLTALSVSVRQSFPASRQLPGFLQGARYPPGRLYRLRFCRRPPHYQISFGLVCRADDCRCPAPCSRRYTGKTVHRARYNLSLYTSRSVQRSPASVAR